MRSLGKQGKCLAVLGTGSDVGKSVTVAALCRIFRNDGIDVAPFKAQNMSNNSWVTSLGEEMGRAQIVQAQAAKVEPHVDMNPVLLKPSSDTGSQVVLLGKPMGNTEAAEYFHDTEFLFGKARQSLQRLRTAHDLIVMEGAGSCAEVNLRSRDFVNFRMAHCVQAPVIVVADIDRGGVFAQIVGTLEVLAQEDREQILGFIINRFRGDASLFNDGIAYLEKKTALPILGLVPYFYHIEIDSEDGLPLDTILDPKEPPDKDSAKIAAIRLPHISNFTDFGPLERQSGVTFHYLSKPRDLSPYDLLILPGTKNVRFDLDWLRETDWADRIFKFAEKGGRILGICGGYQALGSVIVDSLGIEGAPGETLGLGLLEVQTNLGPEKILTRSAGVCLASKEMVEGYEIHMGQSDGEDTKRPMLLIHSRNGKNVDDQDGATSKNGAVSGTYFHGLFDSPQFRQDFLTRLRPDLAQLYQGSRDQAEDSFKDRQYDLLADHFKKHLDMEKIYRIIKMKPGEK